MGRIHHMAREPRPEQHPAQHPHRGRRHNTQRTKEQLPCMATTNVPPVMTDRYNFPRRLHRPRPKNDGLAITGMVLGIVGLLVFVFAVLPVLAIVFSAVALRRISRSNGWRKGTEAWRLPDLVCGIVGTVVGLVNIVAVFGA